MDEIIEVGGGAWHRAADFVGCFPRLPMGTGARIIQNAFSPHPLTKALTDIKSVDGVTRQSAKHQHQEAELDPLQPANPWQGGNRKRSGMRPREWQLRGEDKWSSSGKLTVDFFVSATQQKTLAIEALVRRRCDELGLTPPELIRRCGYQNVSKGLRRLEQLRVGDFKKSAGLIDMLPAALNVPSDVIKQAVEESRQYLRESEEAAWRAAFRPHAIVLTERQRPQPLFVAALIGVDVLLRLDFDLSSGPGTFLAQSLDGLRQRLVRWHGCLPAYGRAVGIIINYGPDRAVRFDLEGNAVELFDRAYRPGVVQFAIGGRVISPGELFSVTETTR